MKKYLSIILLIFAIITIALPVCAESEFSNIKAKVVVSNGIEEVKKENEDAKKVQNITVRILEGEYENEEYDMEHIISEGIENITSNPELKEDDTILVEIREKDGEVIEIIYKENVTQNYMLYVIGVILIIILLVISRKRATIIYLLTIILVSYILGLSIQLGWNLILVSSIFALIITISMFISINGMNKETLGMILKAIIGISISGILMYVLFDIMGLTNINVKISEKFVNIKDLICALIVLFSCGMYNAIMICAQYIFYSTNKKYKTKSDNIIEGQRSLKL